MHIISRCQINISRSSMLQKWAERSFIFQTVEYEYNHIFDISAAYATRILIGERLTHSQCYRV